MAEDASEIWRWITQAGQQCSAAHRIPRRRAVHWTLAPTPDDGALPRAQAAKPSSVPSPPTASACIPHA